MITHVIIYSTYWIHWPGVRYWLEIMVTVVHNVAVKDNVVIIVTITETQIVTTNVMKLKMKIVMMLKLTLMTIKITSKTNSLVSRQ